MATTWIVIADGAHARVLEQDREQRSFKPAFEQELFGQKAQSKEIASDRPGRSFDSVGRGQPGDAGIGGRHAMEPHTDPQRHAKYAFAGDLAKHLQKAVGENRFDRLVLIAAPKTLGDLRALLPDVVKKKLVAEIDKDLTNVPARDLGEHLDPALLRG